MKRVNYFIVAYALIAMISFGKVWHEIEGNEGQKTSGAMIAAMCWPLYWSVEAWDE